MCYNENIGDGMKKISLIILTLVMGFCLSSNVLAKTEYDGDGEDGTGLGGCSGKNCIMSNSSYFSLCFGNTTGSNEMCLNFTSNDAQANSST